MPSKSAVHTKYYKKQWMMTTQRLNLMCSLLSKWGGGWSWKLQQFVTIHHHHEWTTWLIRPITHRRRTLEVIRCCKLFYSASPRYSFTELEQQRSTEPVRIREYGWCFGVPPRCSKYRTETKEIVKYQVSIMNKSSLRCTHSVIIQ